MVGICKEIPFLCRDNRRIQAGNGGICKKISRTMCNLILKSNDCCIRENLENLGYEKVAIYGAGPITKLLFNHLSQEILNKIECVIDKRYNIKVGNYNSITMEEYKKYTVDAIIIVPYYYFDEISNNIRSYDSEVAITSIKNILAVIE